MVSFCLHAQIFPAAARRHHPGRPHSLVKRTRFWNKVRGALKLPSGPADRLTHGDLRRSDSTTVSERQRSVAHSRHVVIQRQIKWKKKTWLTFHGLFYVLVIAVHAAAGGCWMTTPQLWLLPLSPRGVMGTAWCDSWRGFHLILDARTHTHFLSKK